MYEGSFCANLDAGLIVPAPRPCLSGCWRGGAPRHRPPSQSADQSWPVPAPAGADLNEFESARVRRFLLLLAGDAERSRLQRPATTIPGHVTIYRYQTEVLPKARVPARLAFGWLSGLQHFLPYGWQDSHIAAYGKPRVSALLSRTFSLVPNLLCTGWRKR